MTSESTASVASGAVARPNSRASSRIPVLAGRWHPPPALTARLADATDMASGRRGRECGSRPAVGVTVAAHTAATVARVHCRRAIGAGDLIRQEILRERVQAVLRGLTLGTVGGLRVDRRGIDLRTRWIGKEAGVVASAERAIVVTSVHFAHRTVGGTGAARLHRSTCAAGAVSAIGAGTSAAARPSAASARTPTGCAATRRCACHAGRAATTGGCACHAERATIRGGSATCCVRATGSRARIGATTGRRGAERQQQANRKRERARAQERLDRHRVEPRWLYASKLSRNPPESDLFSSADRSEMFALGESAVQSGRIASLRRQGRWMFAANIAPHVRPIQLVVVPARILIGRGECARAQRAVRACLQTQHRVRNEREDLVVKARLRFNPKHAIPGAAQRGMC